MADKAFHPYMAVVFVLKGRDAESGFLVGSYRRAVVRGDPKANAFYSESDSQKPGADSEDLAEQAYSSRIGVSDKDPEHY